MHATTSCLAFPGFRSSFRNVTPNTPPSPNSQLPLMAMTSTSHHRLLPRRPLPFPRSFSSAVRFLPGRVLSTATSTSSAITWDDVARASRHPSSDLSGFFDKINSCNRGSEFQGNFVQFRVEDQLVGYVHHRFVDHLRKFGDVFDFPGPAVALRETLRTAEDRTRALDDVIKCLAGQEDGGVAGGKLIPGIRNEKYPVTSSFGTLAYFSLERAAAPFFGIKAYGVHMNGFVERDGKKFLWIAKRSAAKPTYPGMLDHLVAGGLPHGISCQDNMMKECEEEAGIPVSLAREAKPVGAVSYMDINGYAYKRDVLFCYDLKLPEGFVPKNVDGEVESFKLIPVSDVANIICQTHYFKANCNLVIIDFLFRHGYITPDSCGYLHLLESLRCGDCS